MRRPNLPNLTLAPLVGSPTEPEVGIMADLDPQQKGRAWDKYAGEPDDPHFIPSSPIIERQKLSSRQEADLQRACAFALSNIQSSDAEDVAYFPTKRDPRPTKHDKHASFTFGAPKILVKETMPSMPNNREMRRKLLQAYGQAKFEPLEPTHTKASKETKPSFRDPDQQVLWEIRSKLDQRPKTSAAACIDYNEDDTSSSSNRTSRTTPLTSAGITPASASKRFSDLRGDIVEGGEPVPPPATANPIHMDPQAIAQARLWLADELARRRQKEEDTEHKAFYGRDCQLLSPVPYQLSTESPDRPASRDGSVRAPIKEDIRSAPSNAGSARTLSTLSSARSAARMAYGGARDCLFPRRSSSMSSLRAGRDHGDEYFIDASQVHLRVLNRPLPPLPGPGSYQEPPRHLADLVIRPETAEGFDDGANRIINEDGVEKILSDEELERRKEDMSRAVLEKMTTGSIGSGEVIGPDPRRSSQTKRSSNLNDNGSRPATQSSSKTRPYSIQSLNRIMDEDFETSQEQRQRWRQRMSQNIVSHGKLGDATAINDAKTAASPPKSKKRHSVGLRSPFLKRFFHLGKNKHERFPVLLVDAKFSR